MPMNKMGNNQGQNMNYNPNMNQMPYNNGYPNQYPNQDVKKDNKKMFIIIGIAVVAIVVFAIILIVTLGKRGDSVDSGNSGSSSSSSSSSKSAHKNNVGVENYKDKDVDMNCEMHPGNGYAYTDVLLDYKVEGGSYEAIAFNLIVREFPDGVTDDDWDSIIDTINIIECDKSFGSKNCTVEKHLEVGITSIGFDTTLDRKDKSVEIFSYQPYGQNIKSSSKTLESIKTSYEDQVYTCH